MASSSCALELRAAGPARELLQVREKQGGASTCHLAPWGRRTMGAKASLRAAQAAGHSATKGISSSFVRLERSFPEEQPRESVTPEKLDQWMRESIGEIVRNVGEEPFLMRIFSVGGAPGVRLESEAALPESWPRIKKRWNRESRTTDAIILVEVLEQEEESGAVAEEATATCCVAGGARRTLGLVVQGRGMDSPACFILDTTRVKSSLGFCTHFCLARAKCFGEPVHVQLRNAWLQGRG
ncbi:hypothetical protein OPV22_008876 [Ensete ventricosum]|uniref:DUF7804 domain-containing protein n=1 Tax=Ensete ventricosum TaxID=4639 RepID=A0AAV8PQV5_ENSVE|nr:hypothetical protein OPV22_008876 [Ensete ventricosum]